MAEPIDINQLIIDAATKYGIPPAELLAIKRNETGSGSGIGEVSRAGAIGPLQLMPATARELGGDPNDPTQNIDMGARYYAQMRKQFNDPVLAAAAYNAGPGRVAQYLKGGQLPTETQGYIQKFQNQMAPGATPTQINVSKPFGSETPPVLPGAAAQPEQQKPQMPGTAGLSGQQGLYPQFPQAQIPPFLQAPPVPRRPLDLSNIHALLGYSLPTMQSLLKG